MRIYDLLKQWLPKNDVRPAVKTLRIRQECQNCGKDNFVTFTVEQVATLRFSELSGDVKPVTTCMTDEAQSPVHPK